METQVPNGKEPLTNFSLRVPIALWERFKLVADAEGRSATKQVRRAIEREVREFERG